MEKWIGRLIPPEERWWMTDDDLCLGRYRAFEVHLIRWGCPVPQRCEFPVRIGTPLRPWSPPLTLMPVNTDSTVRQSWPWVNTKANTWRPTAHTHQLTARKPISAAHYRAGQVQVLTRATINPWIPTGLLDVHSERLTRLNVRAVASVMRQDNCAVFQLEQVSCHWPWDNTRLSHSE